MEEFTSIQLFKDTKSLKVFGTGSRRKTSWRTGASMIIQLINFPRYHLPSMTSSILKIGESYMKNCHLCARTFQSVVALHEYKLHIYILHIFQMFVRYSCNNSYFPVRRDWAWDWSFWLAGVRVARYIISLISSTGRSSVISGHYICLEWGDLFLLIGSPMLKLNSGTAI